MRYSQEFKDNVVARLLSKELSISEAVEQYSIGKINDLVLAQDCQRASRLRHAAQQRKSQAHGQPQAP